MKKKLFYFLSAFVFVFTSCSNDAETNKPLEPSQQILPKAIVYQSKINDETQTNTLVYNGNKILNVSRLLDGKVVKTVFTYSGNLITKTEGFIDNVLISTTNYTYDKNKLKEAILILANVSSKNGFYMKRFYTHNSDGTISYVIFRDYAPNIAEDGEKIMTFKDGNLVKTTTKYLGEPSYYNYVYEYKYDSKNNPLKNIVGLDLILFDGGVYNGHDMSNGDFGINDFGLNNVIEKTTIVSSKAGSETYVEKLSYTYDETGFPLTKKTDESEYDIIYTY